MRRRPSMPSPKPARWPHLLGVVLALSFVAAAMPSAAAAIDTTPPNVTYSIDGIVGLNNWYRGNTRGNFIVVHWSVSDPESPIISTSGCSVADQIPGPNTGTTRTCSATSDGGTTTITTRSLKIDADPPTGVGASVSRGADFNGWYNHPLGISWHGNDATSGIASCSVVTYAGPDGAGAGIGGGCTDNAGNGAAAPVAINYDATAPVLSKVSIKSGAASDLVRWNSSSPSDTVVIQRWARGNKQPAAGRGIVFQGAGEAFTDKKIRSSVEYTYAVQTIDQAGNASRKLSVLAFPKVLTLGKKTPYTPRAAPSPILRWGRSRGANYYHVQLFRGSKRIYATWPPKNQLGLPSAWRWSGHRYRLAPGRYRWYVWAGLGKRSFARYRAVGSAQFIIPR
jgi:hypothetical protein